MGFKAIINDDLNSVFLNLDEFADTHKIGSKTAKCILDEERFQEKQKYKNSNNLDLGIFVEGLTLFISESFFKYPPHTGETLKIDDVKYSVLSCKRDMGILEIDLQRYEES